MFTANLDGSDLRQVIPYGKSVSHFDWRNDREIIATFNLHGRGRVHVLFADGEGDYQHLGEGCLDFDGHCTFSPDQQWLATDRKNGKALTQSLILYDTQRGGCTTLAELDMRERRFISGDLRCDFHPRWSRTGNAICFDALDPSETRQLHIARLKPSERA
jgi:prepilin-type processing-associated H-X9-DG protein